MLDLLGSMHRAPRERLSLEIFQQPRAAIFETQNAQVPMQDPHADMRPPESDPQTQGSSISFQPSYPDLPLPYQRVQKSM